MMNSGLLNSLSPDEAEREAANILGKHLVSIQTGAEGKLVKNVLVEEQSSGQTVGWSALIRPYRFTLSATTAMESEVIALRRSDLDGYFMMNPVTGYVVSLNVAGVMGQRLQTVQAMWLREVERMVEARCA